MLSRTFLIDTMNYAFWTEKSKIPFTVSYNGKSHYLLANVALVGESIILAMRTNKKAM